MSTRVNIISTKSSHKNIYEIDPNVKPEKYKIKESFRK